MGFWKLNLLYFLVSLLVKPWSSPFSKVGLPCRILSNFEIFVNRLICRVISNHLIRTAEYFRHIFYVIIKASTIDELWVKRKTYN